MATKTETEILQLFENAIVNFASYSTVWDQVIYYSDSFQPSGRISKGRCPLVVFPNGVTSSMRGVTFETFQGAAKFSIYVAITAVLINQKLQRTRLAVFSQELVDAMKPVTDEQGLINMEIGFGETQVLHGMIVRTIEVNYDTAECK